MQPFELTLADAARRIRTKELSPVELTESVLARIDAINPEINAFSNVTVELANEAAARATREIAAGRHRGPLHGIPIGVKEIYDMAGVPSTSSSRVRADHVPEVDSTVVAKLRQAGAVVVGRTHSHEFAYGVVTPQTRNPWRPDRIAGGSSGGSAAAVAVGGCFLGLGSDTAGSIRIPAALCGTIGLKPTYGRVSRTGVTPFSWSLDHAGPLTRTVEDAALVMNVMAGYDPSDPGSVDMAVPDFSAGLGDDLTGTTAGIPANFFTEHVDPEIRIAVESACDRLAELGVRLREVQLPMAGEVMAIEFGILQPEASSYHRQMLREHGDLYTDDVRRALLAGFSVSATDYLDAQQKRERFRQQCRKLFDDIDILLAPTVPVAAMAAAKPEVSWPDGVTEGPVEAYIRFSAPANLAGLPALSVPCGFTGAGLPVGLQIVGRAFDEATVLRVGHAYQSAQAWATLANAA
ncbi:Asp-tRNA(Asn)/Glu-tRNA(Gln) amidotransferase GatCAB subunit A [Mycobacterium asiaticum]|uniref:Amidase n=1 Tax=Mycobacterium asiaticum TaxID=1790 RepID=A0A1A3L227_MYCAS|nr:Asp-tRNA(Asn)/Glu-tRNA(Gln) amidotransferase GatCAB subunit A [Mycobacterium asiaticum]OBJ90744.1 amidase [Mycobacterium asiaticum]